MTQKFRSFSNRLTQRIVYAVFLTMGFIAVISFFTARNVMISETEARYFSIMHLINEKIEKSLVEYVVAARNVRYEMEQRLDSPEAVMTTLKEEMQLNPVFLGYGAAFEPDYYSHWGHWFEPYIVNRGDKLPVLLQIGSSHHDYFSTEWYQKGKKATNGVFVGPYFDNTGAKEMVVSYVQPIRDHEGRVVGVMGADIAWKWMQEEARKIEHMSNHSGWLDISSWYPEDIMYHTFIVNSTGKYILHQEEKRIHGDNFFDDAIATRDTIDDHICREIRNGQEGMAYMKVDGKMSLVLYHAIDKTDWAVIVAVPVRALFAPGLIFGLFVFGLILIGVCIIYWICHFTIRRSTLPLQFLAQSADEVAKGNFNTPLPDISHNDEIRHLRDSFGNMQHSLTSYIEQLKTTTAAKASMESELSIASRIQMSMLPTKFPERHDVSIFGSLKQAKAIGGDLYDFFIRDGKLFFCIGDVLGKGTSAAMLMTVTRNLFRAYSANDNKPETIVAQINKTMSENNENSLFVTLFVGVLDLLSGRLLYCSAGHEPPLLISDKASVLPFVPAFPIGAFDDAKYQALEALIAPNTTLFLFTDGLNEAINTSKERFDRESIMVVAHQAIADRQLSPQSLIQRMEKAVETFVGEAEQSDDLTMLAIQRLSSDTICLKASSEEYPRMTAYVKGLADAVGLDTYRAGRLRLMIEETVGNIIDYSGAIEITLTAHVTDQQLCVTITDDGQPFNPTTVPDPDLSVPGEKRKAGGLGTMLMRKMCDRITYRREEHQNVLEMYGTISSESLANSPDTISL